MAGAGPNADDPAAHAGAGLHAAACAAVLLRGARVGAEPPERHAAVGRARSRSSSYGLAARSSSQRNPYYHGSRHPQVQRIIYRFGAFASQIRLQLEHGEADYGVVTPSAFAALARRFKGDPRHLLVVPQPIVAYLALNTERPLFKNNPWLRRAVNYALDRPALVRLFGPQGATPSDEYLPPGFPGYQAPRLPVGAPDLAKARALAQGHLRGGHAVSSPAGRRTAGSARSSSQTR